jgi:hypothetical protein
MSLAALSGSALLSTVHDPSKARDGLMRLAYQLPLALDQRPVDVLTTVIEQSSSKNCGVKARSRSVTAAGRTESPVFHDSNVPRSAGSSPEARQAMQAASTASWLEAKKDSEDASRSSVIWLLNEPSVLVASETAPRFAVSGINVSDQTLRGVHGTLKPDSSQQELKLALKVQGNKFGGDTIPAGARFSLESELPKADSPKQLAGAILTFRYINTGQQKTTIMYLTPSIIARLAKRG